MNSTRNVSSIERALIVFVDVIDSSKHSSILGIMCYADLLLKLQGLFKELGDLYFPRLDNITSYSDVSARGDEGTIFYINNSVSPDELVFKAVEFVVELKAKLEILTNEAEESDRIPRRMKVGAGIHIGEVATIVELEKDENGIGRSIISGISGFSINYAKRIESCSRKGRFSKIFLSKQAASWLDSYPIISEKYVLPIRGVAENEDVFEVRSAFFEDMPRDKEEFNIERFIKRYAEEIEALNFIDEPWLKSVVVSVLHARYKETGLIELYGKKFHDFIWKNVSEDDPIVLFWRGKLCQAEKKHTQMLRYYKLLVETYPEFVAARKKLVEACWEISKNPKASAEGVMARDIAEEFLHKYSAYLSDDETKHFKHILKSTMIKVPKKQPKTEGA